MYHDETKIGAAFALVNIDLFDVEEAAGRGAQMRWR